MSGTESGFIDLPSFSKTVIVYDNIPDWTGSYVRSGGLRTFSRISTTTPGYRKHAAKPLPENRFHYGENGQTYLSGLRRQHYVQYPPSGHKTGWVDSTGVLYSQSPTLRSFSSLETASVLSRARNGLLLKIKDQDVNVAQFYAEREQTVRLITDNVKRLGKAALAMRHGNIAGAAKALGVSVPHSYASGKHFSKLWERNQSEALSRGWLELQYGWLPLLSDIYGAIEFSQKQFIEKPIIFKVSTRKKIENKYSEQFVETDVIHIISYDLKYEVSCRCSFRLTTPPLKTLSALGITNPLYLAWELLPFSFVADWFIPIGSFLSALDATLGVTFVSGSETLFSKRSATWTTTGRDIRVTVPGYYHFNSVQGSWSSTTYDVSCDRIGYTSFPLATLPVFKNPFSSTHLFNALALLKLNFRK